jgi:hypothetical protein
MPSSEMPKGYLTLGWRLDDSGVVPKFKAGPLGAQTDEYLVRVPAASIGCHTAIIAQSGSGKLFFLGRLIEELMLETQSRCVILDPNADFRRVADIVDKRHWESPAYDFENHRGFLPHEASKDVFAQRWRHISKRVEGGPQFSARLMLHWPSLSFEFLADDVVGMQRSDLYHCHEFVKAIAYLLEIKYVPSLFAAPAASTTSSDQKKALKSIDFIDEANKLLKKARRDPQDMRELFEKEFNSDELAKNLEDEAKAAANVQQAASNASDKASPAPPATKANADAPPIAQPVAKLNPDIKVNAALAGKPVYETLGSWYTTRRKMSREDVKQVVERAMAAVEYISDEVQRYYFGKAKEYLSQRIVRTRISRYRKVDHRLKVIDLPSFPDQKTRFLALNSVLSTIWEQARSDWAKAVEESKSPDMRVPTFIVVDEAHNLLPKETDKLAAKALLDQFRTIAAEGRKYGLFLILCTQRPDKIDEVVLSECENQAILKLGSQSVLDLTTRLLGLEKVQDKEKCLIFRTGRALLIGRWAKPSPQLLYTAMRRTEEGGKNLRDEHWAIPYSAVQSSKPEKSQSKTDTTVIAVKEATLSAPQKPDKTQQPTH